MNDYEHLRREIEHLRESIEVLEKRQTDLEKKHAEHKHMTSPFSATTFRPLEEKK